MDRLVLLKVDRADRETRNGQEKYKASLGKSLLRRNTRLAQITPPNTTKKIVERLYKANPLNYYL
mgnify:CR=1 FL=1